MLRVNFLYKILSLILIFAIYSGSSLAQNTKITSDSVHDLEFGYALPGSCWRFSPDSAFIETNSNGVYEVVTGQKVTDSTGYGEHSMDSRYFADRETGDIVDLHTGEVLFTVDGKGAYFLQNNTYVVADTDGVYDMATGDRLYSFRGYTKESATAEYLYVDEVGLLDLVSGETLIESSASMWDVTFSNDDKYVVIEREVFEISNGELLFEIRDTGYRFDPQVDFSPDSNFLAVEQVGIYSISGGELLIETDGWTANFDNTGKYVGFADDAIYEVGTWTRLFDIEGGLQGPYFSIDGQLAIVYEWGVYKVPTGDFFQIQFGYPQLSPDQTMLFVGDSIYSTDNWSSLFQLPFFINNGPAYYSDDNQSLAMFSYGNYDYNNYINSACMIYALKGTEWAYRSGLVRAINPIDAYTEPNGNIATQIANELIVFAQTEDSEWYLVTHGESYKDLIDLWVRASEVDIITLPDEIPILSED